MTQSDPLTGWYDEENDEEGLQQEEIRREGLQQERANHMRAMGQDMASSSRAVIDEALTPKPIFEGPYDALTPKTIYEGPYEALTQKSREKEPPSIPIPRRRSVAPADEPPSKT